jgi:hypothetical protein
MLPFLLEEALLPFMVPSLDEDMDFHFLLTDRTIATILVKLRAN